MNYISILDATFQKFWAAFRIRFSQISYKTMFWSIYFPTAEKKKIESDQKDFMNNIFYNNYIIYFMNNKLKIYTNVSI